MKFLQILFIVCLSTVMLQAQSIEELQEMKAEKVAQIGDLQGQINTLQGEVDGIQKDIDQLAGWRKGFSGLFGFDFNNSNNWIANPNPDAKSSSMNISLTGYANREGEKYFWNNKGILTKSWQDVDLTEADRNVDGDGLFNNGTVDILNFQSLYGYRLSDKFAISAMGDLNTSLSNFLNPGTLDLGLGATWVPTNNLTVVMHPFNYRLAFSGLEGVDTEGAIGAKIRADYTQKFNLAGKNMNWSSTLMTYIPYATHEPALFEYTWLNTLSFEVWKGIGVGVGFGLRNAEFESVDSQTYYSIGISYSL